VASIVHAAYTLDLDNSLPCLRRAADFFVDQALKRLVQTSIRANFLNQIVHYGNALMTFSISVSEFEQLLL
jgi:hypothetical protein